MEILPQFRLVVDTNSILQELLFIVESQRNPLARTNLQEAIDSGAIAAFAPLKLKEEISRHIPRLAAERGIPEESLTRAWREYESRINYVNVEPTDVPGAVTVADPDDLPFVYLYRKINADAVLTKDKHIPAMGAESVELEAVLHVRDYARAKAPEMILRADAAVITIPVVAGVLAIGKLSGRAVKTFSGFPEWVQLALLLGTLAVGINPRSRKALSTTVSPLMVKLKENVPCSSTCSAH
jgi:predicted nucleic acid-binding protein